MVIIWKTPENLRQKLSEKQLLIWKRKDNKATTLKRKFSEILGMPYTVTYKERNMGDDGKISSKAPYIQMYNSNSQRKIYQYQQKGIYKVAILKVYLNWRITCSVETVYSNGGNVRISVAYYRKLVILLAVFLPESKDTVNDVRNLTLPSEIHFWQGLLPGTFKK